MTKFDVIGFGALNVDRLFKVDRIAVPEEESYITSHEVLSGGSAANTCVGLVRLGCKVGFVGKVGGDREGFLLIEDFKKEGVNVEGVVCAGFGESGSVLGFIDEQGQRALYIHSGVNDSISIEEVLVNQISNSRFLHLSSFVGDKSFNTQKELLGKLSRQVKISFDPGALYARRGYIQLAPIIERAELMLPNAFELKQITGEKDPHKGAKFLLDRGVAIVAVKLGEKGCFVANVQEEHNVGAIRVNVIDTTGAGDAFNAGFLYGYLTGKSLLECGKIGNFVASRKVAKMGARAGLPLRRELEFSR